MIEPVSDALTTEAKPCDRATIPMMSSGALLSVELRRPPIVVPNREANSSVVSPISSTSGTIAVRETKKTSSELAW